ncbi:MAG: ATP-binding cassette domain-containing protein [Atopobiaceae bacterium]|nr:ATP-binding cassette domain-containing protein [Atopobiaceae bacterium]
MSFEQVPLSACLRHVTLDYGAGIVALDDVSLELKKGERLCVLGANGSGKSTLGSVICGLLAPDAGDVSIVGEHVCVDGTPNYEAYRSARQKLGLVFQNPDDQIVTSIVDEDVAFGPENLGVGADEISRRVTRELERVAMQDYAKADPTRLSGGQKQRVAIAGALAMEPEVLVLDEPGALLDVRGRRGIMRVMRELSETGVTVVHITHFMEEALEADRVAIMNHGKITLLGTPSEVFSHNDELESLGLEKPFATRLAERLRKRELNVPWTCSADVLQASIVQSFAHRGLVKQDSQTETAALPSTVAAETIAGAPQPQASTQGAAQPQASEQGAAQAQAQPKEQLQAAAIELQHVSYSYNRLESGHKRTINDISTRIEAGERVAIVGQTGSGKSTLVRLICSLELPDEGKVLINGIDNSHKRARRQLWGKVGYVMQHPERQLFAETVAEDVAYGPKNLGLAADEVERRCNEALELVGLAHRKDSSPFKLSGGQQRLAAIAGILAMAPNTIVLDEPMAGLDPQGRLQLRRILKSINASGVTVVQVTHSMESATHANHVIVLKDGSILMEGSPREVFSPANKALLRKTGLGIPKPLAWSLDLEEAGVPYLGKPLTTTELSDALKLSYAGSSVPSYEGEVG